MTTMSVSIFCVTILVALYWFLEFKREEREHKDVVSLGVQLEKKLQDMEDLRARMNQLLLKNGLGR